MRLKKLTVFLLTAFSICACEKESPVTALPRLKSLTSVGANSLGKTEFYYNADGNLFQTTHSMNGNKDLFTEYYYLSGKIETAKTFWVISGTAPKLKAETDFKYSGGKLVSVEIKTLDDASAPNGGVNYHFDYSDGEIPIVNVTYPKPIIPSAYQDSLRSPNQGSITFEEYPTNASPEQIPLIDCEFDNKSNPLYSQPFLSAFRFTFGGTEQFSVSFNPQLFFFKNNITKTKTLGSGLHTTEYKYNQLGLPVSSVWRTDFPVGLKSETLYEYGQ